MQLNSTEIAELIKKRYGFEVVEFNNTKELMPYLHPVFQLLNKAFNDLPYVTTFSDSMIEKIGAKYFKVLKISGRN